MVAAMRSTSGWWLGVLGVGAVGGCGGAGLRAETAPANDNVPPVAAAEPAPPPAPSGPTERTVLVDGVRGAVLLDELGGLRLVHGAGTVALVDQDGHVRASHRFAFGADGASAVFLDATQAVVGNGDQDGFRGPWAGDLDRWRLDTDEVEELARLGYASPLLARVGEAVVVVSPADEILLGVTRTGVERRDERVDQLVWPPGRPAECYVGNGEETWLVHAASDGALSLREVNGPVPAAPLPSRGEARPTASEIGARGLPGAALAPEGGRLAVSTSSTMHLLGSDGIGPELASTGYLEWDGPAALHVGPHLHPIAQPTPHRRSLVVEHIPYAGETEDGTPPEIAAYDEWRYEADEALEQGVPVPPPRLEPVCSSAPVRCVRAHLDGLEIDGWELFDPARPTRVLGRIRGRTIPPGEGYVVVAPGGVFVRDAGETVTLTPLPRGTPYTDVERWAELEAGWALVAPDDPATLHFVPTGGRAVTRVFAAPVEDLTIVDAGHLLIVQADGDARIAHVLTVPDLRTERTLDLGTGSARMLRCGGNDLVEEQTDRVAVPGGCPIQGLGYDDALAISMSADRAFWLDARLGDELRVHRVADGATLTVRVTTAGVLASGPGGVFEATGEVADHVVVREPGPVRTAPITSGAEARARFERPGLVAAFFAGRPLPL
jgi:hypothetical protein